MVAIESWKFSKTTRLVCSHEIWLTASHKCATKEYWKVAHWLANQTLNTPRVSKLPTFPLLGFSRNNRQAQIIATAAYYLSLAKGYSIVEKPSPANIFVSVANAWKLVDKGSPMSNRYVKMLDGKVSLVSQPLLFILIAKRWRCQIKMKRLLRLRNQGPSVSHRWAKVIIGSKKPFFGSVFDFQ